MKFDRWIKNQEAAADRRRSGFATQEFVDAVFVGDAELTRGDWHFDSAQAVRYDSGHPYHGTYTDWLESLGWRPIGFSRHSITDAVYVRNDPDALLVRNCDRLTLFALHGDLLPAGEIETWWVPSTGTVRRD